MPRRAKTFATPPDTLVAVDPGTTNLGIALFEGGTLARVGYLRRPTVRDILDWVGGQRAVWVREKMQKYPDRPTTHKDLDRIERLMKATAKAGGFRWAAQYHPMTWKRNVPKNIHHGRLASALATGERRFFSKANGDGKDAVGIGLYALRRTGAGGTPRENS